MSNLDEAVFRAINQAGSNVALDDIMVLFTILGMSFVIVFICVPVWLKGRRELAVDIVAAVILASLIAELIKLLVDRQRPFEILVDANTIISASGPSFPSAHASRAFAVATLFLFSSSRRTGIVAFAIAALIAVSRVYLGVHWPSDVIAGALVGIAMGYAVHVLGKDVTPYARVRSYLLSLLQNVISKPRT